MTRYAALIPIKDHSERVSGKNFRALHGRPLWQWIVATLSSMEEIGEIFIDTDSQRFTPDALSDFPKVRIIPRPKELHGDFVPTNHIFAHDLSAISKSYTHFIQTHTTNPILAAETIRRGMAEFAAAERAGTFDSLFAVTAYQGRFYRRDGSAINHDPKVLLRTQDLDPVLEENSNLYLFTRASFAATSARIGQRPLLFEMNRLEATDIDDAETWQLAEAIIAMKKDGDAPR